MIRVLLPQHLQTLAGCDAEVSVDVAAPVTQARILDALEQRFPMLRGTVRQHGSLQRRPRVRFFVGTADVSLQAPDAELPASVASGDEPFRIIGAVAGG